MFCPFLFERGVFFCVLCLIVVPLPPSKNQFAVQLNSKIVIISETRLELTPKRLFIPSP
jgi:hypothetical protein